MTGKKRSSKTTRKKTKSSFSSFAALALVALPLLVAAVPQPSDPDEVRIGPDLKVTQAVFGYVDPQTQKIVPARRIDTSKHPNFAWRVELEGRARELRYREEFILPAPARVWQVGEHTTVAADRASAVTEAKIRLGDDMTVRNGWIHTPGDPKGQHVVRVYLDGVKVREFDFVLQ